MPRGAERGQQFLAHFVATRADARANGRHERLGPDPELADHGGYRGPDDIGACSGSEPLVFQRKKTGGG